MNSLKAVNTRFLVKPNLRAKLEFKPFVHSWPAVVTVESLYAMEKSVN
jgi:hypothetical protein